MEYEEIDRPPNQRGVLMDILNIEANTQQTKLSSEKNCLNVKMNTQNRKEEEKKCI